MNSIIIKKIMLIFVDEIYIENKKYKFPCCAKLLIYVINTFFAMGGFILVGMLIHSLCRNCDSFVWILFFILFINILFVALIPLKELK